MSRRVPVRLAAPAGVGVLLLMLPLVGLLVRAPWGALPHLLSAPETRQALGLSLVTASSAALVSVVLGVPLAWVLANGEGIVVRALRTLVTVPLVLPPVVGGVALLLAFGRNGVLGRWLDAWFGITLPFSTAGVVVAETFVAMPFLIIAVESALRSAGQGYDEAAATLGADRWTTFWRVTVPLVRPALVAGTVLAWARALGEFGATITFAGNAAGVTRTMPLEVYVALNTRPDNAIALALVLLVVSVAVLFGLRGRWATP